MTTLTEAVERAQALIREMRPRPRIPEVLERAWLITQHEGYHWSMQQLELLDTHVVRTGPPITYSLTTAIDLGATESLTMEWPAGWPTVVETADCEDQQPASRWADATMRANKFTNLRMTPQAFDPEGYAR